VEAWRQLVAATGDFYAEDLMMGVREASLCGHWKNELAALEAGVGALERQRRELKTTNEARTAPQYQPVAAPGGLPAPVVVHQPVTTAPAGKPLTITAEVTAPSGIKWIHLRYRSVNQHEDYRTLPMLPAGGIDHYRAVIPAEEIAPTWDLMYHIEAMDNDGNGRMYPDLNKETPYILVRLQR